MLTTIRSIRAHARVTVYGISLRYSFHGHSKLTNNLSRKFPLRSFSLLDEKLKSQNFMVIEEDIANLHREVSRSLKAGLYKEALTSAVECERVSSISLC